MKKYKITGLIAIKGQQRSFSMMVWAKSGQAARRQTEIHYQQIQAVTSVQIFRTDCLGA